MVKKCDSVFAITITKTDIQSGCAHNACISVAALPRPIASVC
jgi:hypothetical protein